MDNAAQDFSNEEKPKNRPNNELKLRVIYSFLMMGGGLSAAILGGPLWGLAAALVMSVTAYEWAGIVGANEKSKKIAAILSAVCGFFLVIGPEPAQVFACVAFATVLSITSLKGGIVGILGSAYIALCGFAFANLRISPDDFGLLYIFGLFSVVWATDSSAYAIGRWIKGPKLLPAVSPNKTWSGFLGGVLAGTAAASLYSVLANIFLNPDNLFKTIFVWTIVGMLLSIACQLGDLLESWVKRYFGVKDASSLIPGHGGLLDRLDGHFSAALLLEIFVIFPNIASKLH